MELFLATFQIEAVCAFPRYIPPLSTSQLSCFAQQDEKPASCLPEEMLVMFHPELESARGMLERLEQHLLRCGPGSLLPLSQAGLGTLKQGRKIDLLHSGSDFQLKD